MQCEVPLTRGPTKVSFAAFQRRYVVGNGAGHDLSDAVAIFPQCVGEQIFAAADGCIAPGF